MCNMFKGRVWDRGRQGGKEGQGDPLLGLSRRKFRKRSRLAVARMTPLQRDVFMSLGRDDTSYAQLAQRLGLIEEEVRAQFGGALLILADAFDEPRARWRLWRR